MYGAGQEGGKRKEEGRRMLDGQVCGLLLRRGLTDRSRQTGHDMLWTVTGTARKAGQGRATE